MRRSLPWVLVAFFLAFYVFQAVGYQRERARARSLQTIEGQADALK
jgi:hypothetical protein